jgi:predicted nucleic acid-binding protein
MKTVFNTKIFVDTNILYYANNPNDAFGAQAVARLDELASNNNELIISTQIIRDILGSAAYVMFWNFKLVDSQ